MILNKGFFCLKSVGLNLLSFNVFNKHSCTYNYYRGITTEKKNQFLARKKMIVIKLVDVVNRKFQSLNGGSLKKVKKTSKCFQYLYWLEYHSSGTIKI